MKVSEVVREALRVREMTNPRRILEIARTILLVDWPSLSVPRALLESGFTVFGYSPGRYSTAEISPNPPPDVDSGSVFAPKDQEKGYLVFRRLDGRPSAVDIVSVYRPAEEMPGIIADHVLPLRAKVIWLQRPVASSEERAVAEEHGLVLIEGSDIAELARTLHQSK